MSTRPRTGMKRDCACPRAKHVHGTVAAYQSDGCDCFPCRAAMADVRTAYKRSKQHGTPRPITGQLVDATGTRRRMQALAVIGWDGVTVGRLLGRSSDLVSKIRHGQGPRVMRETAAKVARLYDELSMSVPTGRAAALARNNAARHGWAPPLAWDDDTIDDPKARPHGISEGRAA